MIIGVMGRVSAGKDTVCNMGVELLREAGKCAIVISCAEPIKQICSQIFGPAYGVPRSAFYGSQSDKEAPLPMLPTWTGRRIMQFVGTECFRNIDTEVWSRTMYTNARRLLQDGADVVFVSDVRFWSEARIIQEHGGIVLRLFRASADAVPATHASEQEMDEIRHDHSIDNHEQDLYCLRNRVEDFLCQLRLLSSGSTPRPREPILKSIR